MKKNYTYQLLLLCSIISAIILNNSCKSAHIVSDRVTFPVDTLGFWNNIRSFQLANGAEFHDLSEPTSPHSRYSLLFSRFRLVDEAGRPGAAEMALRWLLSEPTAPNQPTLVQDLRQQGGTLELRVYPDAIGLELQIPADQLLIAIERLFAHLNAPRWNEALYYKSRDLMAANRVTVANNTEFSRFISPLHYYWGSHPYASSQSGSYDDLMSLKAEDVRSAFRRLWFSCPKTHVLSLGKLVNHLDYSHLYQILESIPNTSTKAYPYPRVSVKDTRFQIEKDTISTAYLYGAYVSDTQEVIEIDYAFWAYVVENVWNADLCQKRYLTCSFGAAAHISPQPYVMIHMAVGAPNTTIRQATQQLRRMSTPGSIASEEFLYWKKQYLLDWYSTLVSPTKRHQSFVEAASREEVMSWTKTSDRLASLNLKEFVSHHDRIIEHIRWLYIGNPDDLQAGLIQEVQLFPDK